MVIKLPDAIGLNSLASIKTVAPQSPTPTSSAAYKKKNSMLKIGFVLKISPKLIVFGISSFVSIFSSCHNFLVKIKPKQKPKSKRAIKTENGKKLLELCEQRGWTVTVRTKNVIHTKHEYVSYEEYDAMSQLRKCYEDLTLNVTYDKIELKTKGEFLCATYHNEMPYMEITIKSDYKIEDSNANTQDSNTATWKITKNNYKKTPIEITLDKNNVIEEEEKEFPIKNIIIITLFIIAVIYILKNRKKYKQ